MTINKIVLNTESGEQVLVDLTGDTVTPETLAEGVTAHAASGAAIVGTHVCEGGGEGTDDIFAQFIEGNLTELNSNATMVADNVFRDNGTIETITLPNATEIGVRAFSACSALVTVKIPSVTAIGINAFSSCLNLRVVDCAARLIVADGAFEYTDLNAFIIRNNSNLAILHNANAFYETPIANGNGYIYVPRSMIDAYTAADNWSDYADQFRVLEDYTVDGTINGDLIESEIEEVTLSVMFYDVDAAEFSFITEIITGLDMTWSEWIGSEYNADSAFTISDDGYVLFTDTMVVANVMTSAPITGDDSVMYLGEDNIVVVVLKEVFGI